MQFRTKIEIPESPFKISHQDKILMIGSCFAENVGDKLIASKLNVNLNPFGILYNPASIGQALYRLMDNTPFAEDELFEHGGLYHSFLHHSRFSGSDLNTTLAKMNESLQQAADDLQKTDILFITFGTATIYRLQNNGAVVGNCHKLPSKTFTRQRLSVGNIADEWNTLLQKLQEINPKLKIIFTVSPIRHFKDGAHENQLNKSTLLLAVEELQKSNPNISYFPSYELVLDELRDYRFYSEDMIHPNDVAVNYIWQRFSETYFSKDTLAVIDEWNKIAAAIAHRPFNKNGEEYKHFLSLTINKIGLFKEKYPYICCAEETACLNKIQEEI